MSEVKVVGWYDEKSGSGNWDFQPKTLLPDAVPTVLKSDFDAQRLRADTAEAELKREKEFHAVNVSESERMLAAAEQRIAHISVILSRIIEVQKTDYSIRGGLPHRWECLIAEADAALNQKSEGESHE